MGRAVREFARARARLVVIMPITLGVIFVLLFVAFGTARHAALALVTVPFSLAGGLVALYLRGLNLDVSAAVGFISPFGVAVMSGVLYLSEINRRRRAPEVSLREAVIEGSRVPRHLGLIQDGHRRDARQAGLSKLEGYRRADKARDVLTWCADLTIIPMVSLWWPSTENLARESADVMAVLTVIERKVEEWFNEGLANRLRIRIRPIGTLDLLLSGSGGGRFGK